MRVLILSGALAMQTVAPAPASSAPVTRQATADTLKSVLAQSKPGDTIQLQGAFPGEVVFGNASHITFDATNATFTYFLFKGVTGTTFKGGMGSAVDWHGVVYFTGGSDDTIDGVTAHGGLTLRDGANDTVKNSHVVEGTIYLAGETNVTAIGNQIEGATSDGIDLAGVKGGKILSNKISGSMPTKGAHPDCIQLFAPVKPYPTITTGVEIGNNICQGPNSQGFTAFQGADNVYVHDNWHWGKAYPQGIAFYRPTNSRFENNHVVSMPGATYARRGRDGVWFNLKDPPPSTTHCGNTQDGKLVDKPCPAK